jgi:hypothetical protein
MGPAKGLVFLYMGSEIRWEGPKKRTNGPELVDCIMKRLLSDGA